MKRKRVSKDQRDLAVLRQILGAMVARHGDYIEIPVHEIEAIEGLPMQIHADAQVAMVRLVRSRLVVPVTH